jgi:hypothetical protein
MALAPTASGPPGTTSNSANLGISGPIPAPDIAAIEALFDKFPTKAIRKACDELHKYHALATNAQSIGTHYKKIGEIAVGSRDLAMHNEMMNEYGMEKLVDDSKKMFRQLASELIADTASIMATSDNDGGDLEDLVDTATHRFGEKLSSCASQILRWDIIPHGAVETPKDPQTGRLLMCQFQPMSELGGPWEPRDTWELGSLPGRGRVMLMPKDITFVENVDTARLLYEAYSIIRARMHDLLDEPCQMTLWYSRLDRIKKIKPSGMPGRVDIVTLSPKQTSEDGKQDLSCDVFTLSARRLLIKRQEIDDNLTLHDVFIEVSSRRKVQCTPDDVVLPENKQTYRTLCQFLKAAFTQKAHLFPEPDEVSEPPTPAKRYRDLDGHQRHGANEDFHVSKKRRATPETEDHDGFKETHVTTKHHSTTPKKDNDGNKENVPVTKKRLATPAAKINNAAYEEEVHAITKRRTTPENDNPQKVPAPQDLDRETFSSSKHDTQSE